jgi:hypothetical protein
MVAFETRIHEGLDRPLLLICHALEDKPFVDRLVKELDSMLGTIGAKSWWATVPSVRSTKV